MTSFSLWCALYIHDNVYNGKIIQGRENGIFFGNFFRWEILNPSKWKAGFHIECNGWFWSITNYICCPKSLSHSSLQCSFLSLTFSNIYNKLTPLIFMVKRPPMISVNSHQTRHWLWNYRINPTLQIDTILEMCGYDQNNSTSCHNAATSTKKVILKKKYEKLVHNLLLPSIVWTHLTGLANFSDTLSNHCICGLIRNFL